MPFPLLIAISLLERMASLKSQLSFSCLQPGHCRGGDGFHSEDNGDTLWGLGTSHTRVGLDARLATAWCVLAAVPSPGR